MNGMALYRLRLLGAFQLVAPNGQRLDVTSKKAIALLGLLASANSGERWRAWIQDKLWGSRELRQAQASLRRELHGLRKLTVGSPFPLIEATTRTVRLNLNVVDVDIRNKEAVMRSSGEFLEGIDIAGEESFEEWLREMRNNIADLSGPMPLTDKQYNSPVGLDQTH
ncbi:AfsR/SARP family transcriptional regulator [Sphingopyxis sp. 550A]